MHCLWLTPLANTKLAKSIIREEDSKGEVRIMTFAFLCSTLLVLQDGRQACTKFYDDESLYSERKPITCKIRNWKDCVSFKDGAAWLSYGAAWVSYGAAWLSYGAAWLSHGAAWLSWWCGVAQLMVPHGSVIVRRGSVHGAAWLSYGAAWLSWQRVGLL